MRFFDLESGTTLYETLIDSEDGPYFAPAVKNGYVYAEGGGINAFQGLTGELRWFVDLDRGRSWSPAIDDNYAYAFTGNTLSVISRTTGAPYRAITDNTLTGSNTVRRIAPVLPGDGSVLLVTGNRGRQLLRYNVEAGNISWRVDGFFASNPIVANGKVYTLDTDPDRLVARDLVTGATQWSVNLPEPIGNRPEGSPFISDMVVTNNLIFLSTNAHTYAVDLDTHLPVWSTPRSGSLAVSSNLVLYITTSGSPSEGAYSPGRIDAIDLVAR
jgi:outer membrane protein assembly factor BamB